MPGVVRPHRLRIHRKGRCMYLHLRIFPCPGGCHSGCNGVEQSPRLLTYNKKWRDQNMAKHGYESGRLNLPFVGHCTFAKRRCAPTGRLSTRRGDFGRAQRHGHQWRSGARFGPRGIREASTLFSFGHAGAYDFEDDATYLTEDQVRMVDVGDATSCTPTWSAATPTSRRPSGRSSQPAPCRWYWAVTIRCMPRSSRRSKAMGRSTSCISMPT